MTDSESIAFATMVGDEPIFLPIWINYYARFVAKSQLFIITDGMERPLPPEAEGCRIIRLPRLAPSPRLGRSSLAVDHQLHRHSAASFCRRRLQRCR